MPDTPSAVAIVGGGPAGLAAAEVLSMAGLRVDLHDAMPSVGRKFLLAGKGGLNLSHSEPFDRFVTRYGAARGRLEPMLREFGPQALRDWAAGLGIGTFVGSSGRIFPTGMKAAPLLRAWLHRLRGAGVHFHMRHRWTGFGDGRPPSLRFATPGGESEVRADAVLLALGGASWPKLGSDGAWRPWLQARGVDVAPLRPSNCGFDVAHPGRDGAVVDGWSEFVRSRFAGAPLKTIGLAFDAPDGTRWQRVGEAVVTATGIEGSLVYAASAALRDRLERDAAVVVELDLLPARELAWVEAELRHPRGPRSLSTHLKARLGLHGVKAALLHELIAADELADPARLARRIKALPLPVLRPRPVDEAISSAGGVSFDAVDDGLMLRSLPGVFVAGEMLDWEAPTGGYLLTACFASGRRAAAGVVDWLASRPG